MLEACDQLLRERARIAAVLADLPGVVGDRPQGAQRIAGDRRVMCLKPDRSGHQHSTPVP
jgi:hypothetical protein